MGQHALTHHPPTSCLLCVGQPFLNAAMSSVSVHATSVGALKLQDLNMADQKRTKTGNAGLVTDGSGYMKVGK